MTSSRRNSPSKLATLAIALLTLPRAATADFASMPLAPNTPITVAAPPFSRADPPETTPPEAQRPHPAVARVIVPEQGATSYGSGTLVSVTDTQGVVVTNWHVVRDQQGEVYVEFPDGFRSKATIAKADPVWDLAALTIEKPNVAPVTLARQGAQPGDLLSIAGYGSGSYRRAFGRCTQYVAPGNKQPFEMVELAASARQGDSGGPIFNQNGELAGVLFGEGGGRTAGSYSGRVAGFLEPVIGPSNPSNAITNVAAVGGQPTATQPSWRGDDAPRQDVPSANVSFGAVPSDPFAGRMPAQAAQPPVAASRPLASQPPASAWTWPNAAAPVDRRPSVPTATLPPGAYPPGPFLAPPPAGSVPLAQTTPVPTLPPISTATPPGKEADPLTFLGATRFEQGKSAFAIIGVIAVLSFLTRKSKAAS